MKKLQKFVIILVCLMLISTFGCSSSKKASSSPSTAKTTAKTTTKTTTTKLDSSSPAKTNSLATQTNLVTATVAVTSKPVRTGPFDGGFASQEPLLLNLFTADNEVLTSATKVPIQLADAEMTLAGQFFATTSINYVEALCPSWSNNLGSVTFSIYNWKTDYATTVAGTALNTKNFVDYTDNTWLQLTFATPLPAGEYLWVLGNAVDPDVGIWDVAEGPVNHASDVINYIGGEPIDTFHVFRIQYTKTPNITLLEPSK